MSWIDSPACVDEARFVLCPFLIAVERISTVTLDLELMSRMLLMNPSGSCSQAGNVH
jgi:hypothetical protein